MSTLVRDIRYALRQLRKSPGFFAIIALTLGLGVGVNTAIFSMVDWLVLRSLPIRDPEQMHFLVVTRPSGNNDVQFSYPEFTAIEEQTRGIFSGITPFIFGGLEGAQNSQNGLTVDGVTKPIQTVYVSGSFFPLLGVAPATGRLILPTDGGQAGTDPVVVLSYNYWQSRFDADPTIVGKAALINGHSVTIVGVSSKGFLGPTPLVEAQAYLPLGMYSIERGVASDFLTNPQVRSIVAFARVRPGIRPSRIRSQLETIGQRLLKEFPRAGAIGVLRANPLRPPGLISGETNPLPKLAALLFTLAELVLALACVNVANLFLVRASGRQRELAVRAALGAANSRLTRQLFTESLVVSSLGCAVGVFLGLIATRMLSAVPMQSELPFVLDFEFSWHTFSYAFLVAAAAGLLVMMAPVVRVWRGDLREILHEGGRTSTGGRQRLQAVLVAGQVAACLTLLIVSGLFVRSLRGVESADLGFNPLSVVNLTLDANQIGYNEAQGRASYSAILERTRSLPGVQSASLASAVPLSDNVSGNDLEISGYSSVTNQPAPHALYNAISIDYLETMGITLLRGREFTAADNERSTAVAVINEAMAERFWPNQDPIGRSFAMASDRSHPTVIVGIVGNIRASELFGAYNPVYYRPAAQSYEPVQTLQIRSRRSPHELIPEVRQTIESVAPAMPIYGVRTMIAALHGGNGLLFFELGAALAGSLGFLGLVLAVVGVYALMSYAVTQRTREIGLRMALGAKRNDILRVIGRQGFTTIAIGLGVGLAAAFAIGRLVGDFLVGITATDPLTYVGVSILLAAVALSATYIPVRRASGIDVMVALRHE